MAVTGEDEEWILVGNAMVAADGYLAAVDEDSDEESVISSGSEHSSDDDAVPPASSWSLGKIPISTSPLWSPIFMQLVWATGSE